MSGWSILRTSLPVELVGPELLALDAEVDVTDIAVVVDGVFEAIGISMKKSPPIIITTTSKPSKALIPRRRSFNRPS